jgi:predicted NBD/HSP70 family sugar kinase
MIIAIDIGGTKTLVASYDNGNFVEQIKFLSPKNYHEFIRTLTDNIKQLFNNKVPELLVIGCPGLVNRQNCTLKTAPNLNWHDKPLADDLCNIIGDVPIIIENDANLAALSEANNLDKIEQKVIYITFSTGIGTGFVENGILVPGLLDSEGGHLVFEHDGKTMDWESFAAGRVIVEKYGKKAADLDDPKAWQEIAQNMAIGIVDCCAIFPANIVIIGGSVGTYFSKYYEPLRSAVKELLKDNDMVRIPQIVKAKEPEEAVIRGCIILAKQQNEQY